jgi:hypothetical protein
MEVNEDFQTQPQCYLRNLSMKTIGHVDPGFLLNRKLGIVSTFLFFPPAALIAQQYQQTNLVSDTLTEGTVPPTLISRMPGAPRALSGSRIVWREFVRFTTARE